MHFYAEQDACFKYKLLYVIVIPFYLCRNIWLNCVYFFPAMWTVKQQRGTQKMNRKMPVQAQVKQSL